MESLILSHNRLSRDEILTGLGGSVLVHIIVLVLALVSSWSMPRDGLKGSVYTVNLVSLQDIGAPPPAVRKGTKEGSADEGKSQTTQRSTSQSKAKSSPVVPIKRLNMEEPAARPSSEIKKLDAPDAPKLVDKPVPSASVEKDLEKLVPKPKPAPKPAPIVQNSREEVSQRPSSEQPARPVQSSLPGDKATGKGSPPAQDAAVKGSPDGVRKGAAEGSPTGVAEGGAKGSSGVGGPAGAEGGRVAAALLGMYGEKVRDLINNQWTGQDSLKGQRLETRLLVIVNREGSVLDVRIEKASGNPAFDESAIRAVRKASPLPPLPQIFTYPKLELGLRFSPDRVS